MVQIYNGKKVVADELYKPALFYYETAFLPFSPFF